MKTHFKWICMVFMLALFIPISASAASKQLANIYVQPTNNADSLHAVNAWKKGSTYYLFLPAGMDAAQLSIYFSGPESITIGNETFQSGQSISLLQPSSKLTLAWGNGKQAELRVMQSQNLNALYLTTASGNLDYIHKAKGNAETGYASILPPDGETTFGASLKHMKVRGNGTSEYSKKPYQIKLDKSADLLGMGKSKTWVLLANYKDNSLLRNKIALELSRSVGIEWSCKSTFVDLYVNNDYCGNYQLTEKMEVGTNRINIQDLESLTEAVNDQALDSYATFGRRSYAKKTSKGINIPVDPDDITGGYLLEMELTYRYKNEASGMVTSRGQSFVIKSPKYASQAQVDYIATLLQELEDAIFAKNGVNPTTGKHYTEYIDLDSYARKYLVEEVLKNYDANRTSQYFYKPSDAESTLLYAAPPWDFDQSMDNYGAMGPNLFCVNNSSTSFHWFPKVYKQTDFRQALEACYQADFIPSLNILLGLSAETDGLKSIDTYASQIEASAAMNYIRWPQLKSAERFLKAGTNFDDSVDFIKTFLTRRMGFLAKKWGV